MGKEHRSGIMIHLLWKGIAEYILRSNADYMFGCCSLTSLDLKHVFEVYNYLHDYNVLGEVFVISVSEGYNIITDMGILE